MGVESMESCFSTQSNNPMIECGTSLRLSVDAHQNETDLPI
jgi:hypothetical protein